MIAGYNRAIWPAQFVAYGLALALLWLAARGHTGGAGSVGARLLGLVLAAAWAWTGAVFHLQHFATVNFVAPVYGMLFLVQAVFLAWTGVLRGRIAPRFDGSLVGAAGLAMIGYSVIGYPALALSSDEGAAGTRVIGLAPDPTALVTLGLLLLADGRAPVHLCIVPVLWTLIAGVTAWVLGIVEDLVLPLFGLGSLGLLLWKNRRRR